MFNNFKSLFSVSLLVLMFSGFWASNANAQVLSFDLDNYTDCDVQIRIRINCGGAIADYGGTLAPGGTFVPTTTTIPLVAGIPPANACAINGCNITIMVSVGGTIYGPVTGPAATGVGLTYCCTSGSCPVTNNCTSIRWNPGLCDFQTAPWYCP